MSLHGPIDILSNVKLWIHFSGIADDLYSRDLTAKYLTESDVSRAQRYRSEEKRRQFLVSRRVIFDVVTHVLGYSRLPKSWDVVSQPNDGRLTIQETGGRKILSISLSHSANMTAVAVVDVPIVVGVDIEVVDETLDADTLSPISMSLRELEWLNQFNGDHKRNALRQCWTMKEAIWKTLGKNAGIGMLDLETEPKGMQSVTLAGADHIATTGSWSVQCFGGGSVECFPATTLLTIPDPDARDFCGAIAVPSLSHMTPIAW